MGFDVCRYPKPNPLAFLAAALEERHIEVVIDVGANTGQYATALRELGYDGIIESFEPIPSAYAEAHAKAESDDGWRVHKCGIGNETGERWLNVAGNGGASSSFFPMLDRHRLAAPGSGYTGRLAVPIRTLDESLDVSVLKPNSAFLKIDAQGAELEVLRSCPALLASAIAGVQVELSLVPLYDGGPGWVTVLDFLSNGGFLPMSYNPGFSNPETGELLQVDAVLWRTATAGSVA
jgi:FkbM family methyltransferase